MNKENVLDSIFDNDPLDLLKFKQKVSNVRTEVERLVNSFDEINVFYKMNDKAPEANPSNIHEFQMYSRLKSIKDSATKIKTLKEFDVHNLLPEITEFVELKTIDDIFNNDLSDILGDDTEGLFEFKHTPKDYERAQTDFVARRKPCKDFDKYEHLFKEVQNDLANRKCKLIDFNENQLIEGNYFVHNGILLLLEKTFDVKKDKFGKDDGRTRIIFENGTESGMKLRSLGKNLFMNGSGVTINIDKVNENFINKFSDITNEDEEVGYIYVLKSKSKDERIASIQNLFKIGYSKTEVEERTRNAEKEPTYLMAQVSIEGAWKCFNMNPQKLEQLIHNFFGNSCLELDVFDAKGQRHTPREWFIAPIEVIEQVIELIINGKIVNYKFDVGNMAIIGK